MRIRSAHHARRYHAWDRASRPMPNLWWLPFARKIRHKELFVDLFTPTALHLSLFRFPNNINLIGSAYFEFSVTPMRSRSEKNCPLLEKKWLFSVLFSLKITADLQNKLSGRVHVMTDNLLWNPKNVRDWSCFPFCNPAQCEIFVYVRIVFSKSRSAHFSEISEHKILKNCIYI